MLDCFREVFKYRTLESPFGTMHASHSFQQCPYRKLGRKFHPQNSS